jgi:hypothetical protein
LPFPQPVPGLVLRYSYLWEAEHRRGQEEGVKDRPCAVVLVVTNDQGNDVVTVLPILPIRQWQSKSRMQRNSVLDLMTSGPGW